jgi:hypothetical protein
MMPTHITCYDKRWERREISDFKCKNPVWNYICRFERLNIEENFSVPEKSTGKVEGFI